MSAVLETQEPAARYLEAAQPALVRQFDLLGSAPGGISRLRELILTLAVQGKLTPQLPGDEPASLLLQQIESAKERLIAEGAMKRPKLKDEIAEDELPFPTPPGWQWVRLGTLLQKIGAGSTPLGGKEVYVPSGVKFLRSQNVWNDGLRLDGVAYISPATHAKMAGTVVTANDLLFNITGASIGRCAAVPADFDEANVSQHVTIIRPVLPALNPFLHTVLISRLVQQAVMDVQVGVSREGLSIAKLGNFLVPIPPLQEQDRIVARVADLMRLCDALEAKDRLEAEQHARLLGTLLGTLTDSSAPEELAANWQRVADHFDLLLDRPEAVDALEQTMLQLAVRGLLVPQDPSEEPASELLGRVAADRSRLIAEGKVAKRATSEATAQFVAPFDIPTSWQWVEFADYIHELCTGPFGSVIHKEDYVQGGVPLINPSHMIDGVIRHDPNISVPHDLANRLGAYRLSAGDVLMARRGEVGRYALVTEREAGWLCGTGSFFVRLASFCDRDYFALMLEDPRLRAHLLGESVGATMTNLNQRILLQAPIAVPPLNEQARIAARFAELRRLCADLRNRLERGSSVQTALAVAFVDQALDS